MTSTRIVRPFGGRDRAFDVAPLGIVEALERACDAGMGAIYARLEGTPMMLGDQVYRIPAFRHGDVRETIRLGLVGGGMDSREATELVMAEIDGGPIGPHLGLAVAILTAYLYGLEDALKKADGPVGEGATPAAQPPGPET